LECYQCYDGKIKIRSAKPIVVKNIIAFVAFASSSLLVSPANAQPSADMGKVVLSIHPVNSTNPAVTPGDYVFSMDNGSPIGLTEVSDGNYTDITFTGTFERNKQTTNLTCSIRVTPSGDGTFIFRKNEGGNPPKNAIMSINIDNNVVLRGDRQKGAEGQVIVAHYPKDVGDFLTGTFTATLGNSPNDDEIKDLYKVTGSFKIKKFE